MYLTAVGDVISPMYRNTNKERDEADGDLCAVLYNGIFHQIVVVTVLGIVEVYETQVETL